MGLKVICLLKQTFATEAKINLKDENTIAEDRVKFVVNPYDEFAIEEAIKWREAGNVDEVTLLCVGAEKAVRDSVRKGLAMGADQAVVVDTTDIDAAKIDEAVVAKALAAQLQKMSYDLILCGKVAVDSNSMEVPGRVSAVLDIPLVSAVGKVEPAGDKVVAEREADGRKEVVEVDLPAMIGADKSLNMPRYPTLPNIMKAKKKPMETVPIGDVLGGEPQPARRTLRYALPPEKGPCKFIEGPPEQAAAELVRILRETEGVV
ncbi:electron transfer flavoprotein subunit beta/FixA family protein [bacterium]|nr:electron transfer flavoprotein subunit beta/FixA family protein [bacterium]